MKLSGSRNNKRVLNHFCFELFANKTTNIFVLYANENHYSSLTTKFLNGDITIVTLAGNPIKLISEIKQKLLFHFLQTKKLGVIFTQTTILSRQNQFMRP